MALPEVIIIDCDGVLTDGTLTIDHNGEKLFKKFHTRDVRAIRQLVANGVEVYIVSADGWQGTAHFAEKVGAVFYELRDKARILEHLQGRRFWVVGDDAWDVQILRAAERAFCPSDADPSVLCLEPGCNLRVLGQKGGTGVVAELVTKYFHTEL